MRREERKRRMKLALGAILIGGSWNLAVYAEN
jgi:hypothetical protein